MQEPRTLGLRTKGPTRSPAEVRGTPLPYPRPAPHPFPPPPLLPPGRGRRVQARTRGPRRYDKTPALRGGWEGGREGRGGSASLTLSWSHRTLLRFSSGARFLSRPISSSRSWAADIIVSSWPNPPSPNTGCSAAAAASPPRPTAPPPPRVTETKWRHDSSPCPQCSARVLTASGAWRSAGRARRRPGVGGACRSSRPAEAATAPGSTWRRGKNRDGAGLLPAARPGGAVACAAAEGPRRASTGEEAPAPGDNASEKYRAGARLGVRDARCPARPASCPVGRHGAGTRPGRASAGAFAMLRLAGGRGLGPGRQLEGYGGPLRSLAGSRAPKPSLVRSHRPPDRLQQRNSTGTLGGKSSPSDLT